MEIEGNAEALVGEIRALAQRESAGIILAAEAEAAEILDRAKKEAELDARARAAAAGAEGERRRRMVLASVPVEAGRIAAAELEAVLDSIKKEVRACLREKGCPRAGTAAALAAAAVRGMEGNSFVLRVSPEDSRGLPGLEAEVSRLAGKGALEIVLKEDPGLDGGAAVYGPGGRQYWDNSLTGRLERLWPEQRRLLSLDLEKDWGNHGRG